MSRSNTLLTAALLLMGSRALEAADISVSAPYARAVPPGQPNSAAFMALTNDGKEARALVGAASSAADVVELHTHMMDEGIMKMRRIDKIELPPGETQTLAPGGLHIMLIGLKQDLQPGDIVDLKLLFDDGDQASVKAPVHKIEPRQMPRH